MLYGEDALDDGTVKGILHLTDMYDTKNLTEKCEKYLLGVSKKSSKQKLEMSVKYNLSKLKEKCLSEIKTLEDIRSVLPARLDDMDHSLTLGGILQLADMYDTKTLIGKFEEYLLGDSTIPLKEKLEMSVEYNLAELKGRCMSEIKTLEDIRSVLPACLDDMDHSLMASLFKKTLDLK
ncbi:unnamed protein product [Caenorhabditis brenneri]